MPQHFTPEELKELELILEQSHELDSHDGAFSKMAAELRRLWALETQLRQRSKTINFQRKLLFVSQMGICHYCKKKFEYHEFNVDHKLAQLDGGTDDPDNLVGSCVYCNYEKAHQDYQKFLTKKQGQIEGNNTSNT